MTKFEKLIINMRHNPKDWHIEDLFSIAKRYGIIWKQNGTSHVVFRFPNSAFPVPAKRLIKPIYVIEFLKRIEENYGL